MADRLGRPGTAKSSSDGAAQSRQSCGSSASRQSPPRLREAFPLKLTFTLVSAIIHNYEAIRCGTVLAVR